MRTWLACRLGVTNDLMTPTTLLIWVVIGLVAGWLASAVVGGGYGVVGDIVVGVVGSFTLAGSVAPSVQL